MLAQKLVTLAYNILLLRWTEILLTQCICKEAPLATRFHTICYCLFCHTDFINHSWLMKLVFMLLSKWKSVQEQTQNLRCWGLSVLTASKSLIYMTKLRNTLEIISQDILATCIISLNNFNNQEELIGHMNISPWKYFECPVHRPIRPYCQQTFKTNDKKRATFVFTGDGNEFNTICNK